MNETEIAEKFRQGFDCGQVVFATVADNLGIDETLAYKLAAGLGGGMFRGETCGAVIGAILAIGMKYGHHEADTFTIKSQNMAKVLEFQHKFMEKYPSTVCRELLGYDVGKPDEMAIILEQNLLLEFCPKVTAYAIDILETIL